MKEHRPPPYQLAQMNLALLRAPLDSAELADFVALLEPINALADGSPGFVWRLQTEAGDATALRVYDDDRVLVNMSVWESRESLWNFVYRSRHLEVMQRRREWFHRLAEAVTVLWWVEAGHVPSVGEAKRRMDLLRRLGPTEHAFTFRAYFPPPAAAAAAPAPRQPDEQEQAPANGQAPRPQHPADLHTVRSPRPGHQRDGRRAPAPAD